MTGRPDAAGLARAAGRRRVRGRVAAGAGVAGRGDGGRVPARRPTSPPAAGRAPRRGCGANLARVVPAAPPAELDALVRAGLRSYARYWCETFRLPAGWTPPAVHARMDRRMSGTEPFFAALRRGPRRGRSRCRTAATGTRPASGWWRRCAGSAGSRRSPRWRSGCGRSRCTGGSSPTGSRLGFEVVAAEDGRGGAPGAHPPAAGRRRGLPGGRPRPHRFRHRGLVLRRAGPVPDRDRRGSPALTGAAADAGVPALHARTAGSVPIADPVPVGRPRRRRSSRPPRRSPTRSPRSSRRRPRTGTRCSRSGRPTAGGRCHDRPDRLRVGIVCPYSLDVPGGVQAHVVELAARAGAARPLGERARARRRGHPGSGVRHRRPAGRSACPTTARWPG